MPHIDLLERSMSKSSLSVIKLKIKEGIDQREQESAILRAGENTYKKQLLSQEGELKDIAENSKL